MAEKKSKQPNDQVMTSVLLAILSQIYSENLEEKAELNSYGGFTVLPQSEHIKLEPRRGQLIKRCKLLCAQTVANTY